MSWCSLRHYSRSIRRLHILRQRRILPPKGRAEEERMFGSPVALSVFTAMGLVSSQGRCLLEDSANKQNPETEPEEEDKYANLPEEDEETDCSMCQTFRKGPCRPYWRKLERCFKDQDDSKEEGAGPHKCMRYFYPHNQCLQPYMNLYLLIPLEKKEELVKDIQLSVADSERREWKPEVDWSQWISFVKDVGPNFRQTIPGKESLPLWERLPPDTEPVLITLESNLPQVQETKGRDPLLLKVAYALDQDGKVVGLTFNDSYRTLLEESEKQASSQKSRSKEPVHPVSTGENSETNEQVPPAPTDWTQPMTFSFFALPGETKAIRICALYSEDPTKASEEKSILDVVLCTGPLMVLPMDG